MYSLSDRTKTAIEQGDWISVNATLEQLPLENSQDTIEAILPLVIEALHRCDFQQRWEMAKHFPKIGKPAIAPLIAILESEDEELELRWFVARILSAFDDPACILALTRLLQQSQEQELLAMAASALANIGSSAIFSLTHLLEDSATRLLAVQALSQMRRLETIDPLLTVVNDSSPEIRAIALEALSSFHDLRIGKALLAALKDPSSRVRREAVTATGYLASQYPQWNLVAHLKPLLYDFEPEICQVAVIALGRIGTQEAVAVLFSLLESPLTPDDLKLTVVRALGWSDSAEALDNLATGLDWQDELICQEIITILSRKEPSSLGKQAVRVLENFYHSRPSMSGKTAIKQSLAIAFGELGDKEGQDILLILAADPLEIVRLHALSALKKFAGP